MGLAMDQKNDPTKGKRYRHWDGYPIEVLPYFLYEVSLYWMSPRRSNMLSCRYYTSDKPLKVKTVEVIKRFKHFHLERFITLLGAPMSFIEDNKLPIYETNQKQSKKKKL